MTKPKSQLLAERFLGKEVVKIMNSNPNSKLALTSLAWKDGIYLIYQPTVYDAPTLWLPGNRPFSNKLKRLYGLENLQLDNYGHAASWCVNQRDWLPNWDRVLTWYFWLHNEAHFLRLANPTYTSKGVSILEARSRVLSSSLRRKLFHSRKPDQKIGVVEVY